MYEGFLAELLVKVSRVSSGTRNVQYKGVLAELLVMHQGFLAKLLFTYQGFLAELLEKVSRLSRGTSQNVSRVSSWLSLAEPLNFRIRITPDTINSALVRLIHSKVKYELNPCAISRSKELFRAEGTKKVWSQLIGGS